MSERLAGDRDRSYAEWFVWAKRNLTSTLATCHAAAQAAVLAQESGQDPTLAARQAGRSRSGPGWETQRDEWTRGYAEWFDWARLNLKADAGPLHLAAAAANGATLAGADAGTAREAAQAAVGVGPGPEAPLTRDSAAGAEPAGPVAPVPMAEASTPPPTWGNPYATPAAGSPYSADGRWLWNGTQWLPAAPGLQFPAGSVQGGFPRRLGALLLDALILWVAALLAGLGLSLLPAPANGFLFFLLVKIAIDWAYLALLMASPWQGTPGMLALGIRIVGGEGNRLGFGRASARYFASLVSALFCGLGYLLLLTSKRQQTLHDMLAGTFIVRRESPANAVPESVPVSGGAIAGVLVVVAVMVLTSLLVVVVLYTMGGQISNVFSNVTVALNGG